MTRQALGEIVQRIDARVGSGALLPGSSTKSALAATNEAFDGATMLFFGLRLAEAREALLALEAGLEGAAPKASGPGRDAAGGAPAETVLKGDRLREELSAELTSAEGAPSHALRAFRSRLRLAWEAPSTERSAEFLLDPVRHEAELTLEAAALKRGEDPYAQRRGDHWRTFVHGRRDLAARVYLPEGAPKEGMPLVVAFHGAGGDENFLFELGGDGYLKRLADRHGCLVVAPLTPDFMFSGKPFASLLDGVHEAYGFDRESVFVLGHSMGAMTTSKVAGWHHERLAGACCVAGFSPAATGELPMLVVSGRLDRIVPFQRVESAAKKARESGLPVTFVALEDQGHTLLLPAAMDLAFAAWFGGD